MEEERQKNETVKKRGTDVLLRASASFSYKCQSVSELGVWRKCRDGRGSKD